MTLEITRAIGLVTVQDLGRPGHMHEGLPRGGALVPALLASANRAAGNPAGAAGLEVIGEVVVTSTATDLLVATDRLGARALRHGERYAVTSEPHRVTYLAIRGGIDAPFVLGSRSTHLSAGLGAPMRAGMHVDIATVGAHALGAPAGDEATTDPRIRVIAGPDVEAFAPAALATLTAATYRISPASDRVGTRLEGPALERTATPERTRPMVRGAIEVPRDGQPIVLGPEHPTTGGYPVIAVIAHADLGRFFTIRLGGAVRFVEA